MLSRRALGVGLGACALGLVWNQRAHATSALGLSLEQLVVRSERVALGVAVHAESSWELVSGTRRIVTTTRVVQQADWLSDDEQADEFLVATLGGRVGDLAQKIPGEAQLRVDEPCVVFVSKEHQLRRRVVAMGQGHYPLQEKDRLRVLRTSPSLPHLVGKPAAPGAPLRKRRAVDVLSGKTLSEARDLVRGAR